MWNKRNTNSTNNSKENQKPARVRMTWVNGVPKLHDIRMLLVEAEKNKGLLCELPIRGLAGPFLLSCQSDHLSSEPCWTLYEGEDGSKQLWSYINNDLEMITDITSMSVMNKDSKTEVDLGPATTGGGAAAAGGSGAGGGTTGAGGGLGSQFPRAAQSSGLATQLGSGGGQAPSPQSVAQHTNSQMGSQVGQQMGSQSGQQMGPQTGQQMGPQPAEPAYGAGYAGTQAADGFNAPTQQGGWPAPQQNNAVQWGGQDGMQNPAQPGAEWPGGATQGAAWPQEQQNQSAQWNQNQGAGAPQWPQDLASSGNFPNPQAPGVWPPANPEANPQANWNQPPQQNPGWNNQGPAVAPPSMPTPMPAPVPAPMPAPMPAPLPPANPWGAAAAPTQAPAGNDSIWNSANKAAAQSDNPWRTAAPSGGGNNAADAFIRSLEGRPHVSISELTMDPALPANCVDAVLKLQEMVLKGHFSEKTALEALKLAALNRGILDEGILNKVQARTGGPSDEGNRQAAQILQQSGLITESDLASAEGAASKHGGDVGAALIATGKVDQLILEAAQRGHELISKGSLRPDQIIIALHYCQRMRTKLDDALSDLNIDIL